MDFAEIKSFAESIAVYAGDRIQLPGFNSGDTEIYYKSRTNLLTNIDNESEKYLVNEIRKKFPDHAVIAEEGSGIDMDSEFVWYVDPLDATNNFAHGIPHFCVSIALFSRTDKDVKVGVVYDPSKKELFSAIRGGGASLNARKIRVSEIDELGLAVLATGFPYLKEDPDFNNSIQFNAFLPKVQGIRRMGSAALDLCYTAVGRVDGFWEPMLQPWDVAAGALIVEEAGGKITDYRGNSFNPEFREIVASNNLIHEPIINVLVEVTKKFPGDNFGIED